TIGGTVSGLEGSLVLQNNGGDDLLVSANGPFTFAARIDDGATYDVTVRTQPGGQACVVSQGSGKATKNIKDAVVACASRVWGEAVVHNNRPSNSGQYERRAIIKSARGTVLVGTSYRDYNPAPDTFAMWVGEFDPSGRQWSPFVRLSPEEQTDEILSA